MMKDVEAHYKNPNLPYPSEDNPLLYEMTSYLESTGINNPCLKVFNTNKIYFSIYIIESWHIRIVLVKLWTETFDYSERVFKIEPKISSSLYKILYFSVCISDMLQ